jgi:hypothetical protein
MSTSHLPHPRNDVTDRRSIVQFERKLIAANGIGVRSKQKDAHGHA